MKRILALVAGFIIAATPGVAAAEDGNTGLLLRVGGNAIVAPGEQVGTVIVIDGDAVINGTVSNGVLVIDGDLRVSGNVQGTVTVISGSLQLLAGSTVEDVSLIRSDFERASGATVSGRIDRQNNVGLAGGIIALFSLLFWAAMTVAVVVAGLVFAAVGGRQLLSSTRTMTGEAVNAILGVVFVWIGLPIVAGLAIASLIGLPLGLGILLFLLPALWFLGLLVAGTRLGLAIVRAVGRGSGDHPYLAAFVGLLILQVIVLLPVLGALVVFLAGVWGAGALAVTAFKAAGGKGFDASSTAPAPVPSGT